MDVTRNQPFVIKVCGITSPDDGAIAIGAGATALGLNFYPRSPRYLTLEQAREISAAIPASVLRVGVFVNPTWEELAAAAADVPLDVVQVHGILRGTGARLRLWRACSVDHRFNPEKLRSKDTEAYLLDTPTAAFGGSGQTFDWARLAPITSRAIDPFLVAGGLDGSNVAKAIAHLKPWGVDACSRLETRPGRKDAAKVREFVNAASAAFEILAAEESGAR
jgi:phosphoribosylanthranilate isomerase